MQWITYKKNSEMSVVYILLYVLFLIQVALTIFKYMSNDNFFWVYLIFVVLEFPFLLLTGLKDKKIITII